MDALSVIIVRHNQLCESWIEGAKKVKDHGGIVVWGIVAKKPRILPLVSYGKIHVTVAIHIGGCDPPCNIPCTVKKISLN